MVKKQLMNGAWKWHAADETVFYNGTVPGSVLCDMMQLEQIKDPFWRTNEYETRELMLKDYTYKRSFIMDAENLKADEVMLVCEGLDTIAEIYVNGELLAKVDNMHCTHRLPAKQLLKIGENEIVIEFSSPLRFVRDEDAKNDIHYASTGCIHGNAALRKAHYMFGWDWGPQLPDIGIFRDIYIEYSNTAKLEDVHIRQYHTGIGEDVRLTVQLKTVSYTNLPLTLKINVYAPSGEKVHHEAYEPCKMPEFIIKKPEIWWPNGLGAQPLYTVEVQLFTGEVLQDSYIAKIGLRTITISTQADEWGEEFCFVVNGHKIFAMGANYIPQDNFITRITPARYRQIVAESAQANFNCLRVWGGGYYPDDSFYDACDEFGILVWQDLMFACNVYALNRHFEQNIIAETKDNVRRLRHHASLALWCANNEMEWGWGEGWARILGHHPRYKADYLKIFEMVLPRALRAYDDQTYFWPSSPSSGGAYDYPNDPNRGDQHYWEVWHSENRLQNIAKVISAFALNMGSNHSRTLKRWKVLPCQKIEIYLAK